MVGASVEAAELLGQTVDVGVAGGPAGRLLVAAGLLALRVDQGALELAG